MFEEHKIHIVLGKSGSGKSILFKAMLGLIPLQSGTITYRGKPLQDYKYLFGVQFQHGALFTSLSAGENIMLPLLYCANIEPKLAQSIALEKLRLVGLTAADFHKSPAQLSGGMIKRVALARAIALDPEILFADEPTSGLDPISAQAYDQLILSLKADYKLTVIMITHDLTRIKTLADTITIIHEGKAYSGQYEQLKKDSVLGQYLAAL